MIFVDTSAFIALIRKDDIFHQKANKWWQDNIGIPVFSSNLIFIETMGWIRYKYGKKAAVESGKNFFGGDITLERVSLIDEQYAWDLFQKIDGRGISMIDCTTVAIMKRLRIKEIFTFDADFQLFDLILLPSKTYNKL